MSYPQPAASAEAELTARRILSRFIRQRARAVADDLGFAWTPHPDAPSTYLDLQAAFARSQRTGCALPVSSEHSGQVVYTSPAINLANRFWHDCQHVMHGLSFCLADEYELACLQLHELEMQGQARDSLAYRLFQADTLGQVMLNAFAHDFPADQRDFARDCAQFGLLDGVEAELQRRSQP